MDLTDLILRAGAEPNILEGKNGKSALRLIYENPLIDSRDRRAFLRIFKKYKGTILPEVESTLGKIRVVLGLAI